MVMDIPEEDIPEQYKAEIQDFVFFYCPNDKCRAEMYVNQLRNLGYKGCLYDDETYLSWWFMFEDDLTHLLGKRSVYNFFLVTAELQHESEIRLHKCESLKRSLRKNDNSLVPIFEIEKNNIPDTSAFYGLTTLNGLYPGNLKDGKKFKQLFGNPDSKKRKKILEQEVEKSRLDWIEDEKIRRAKQQHVEEEKNKIKQEKRANMIKESRAKAQEIAKEEVRKEEADREENEIYQKLLPRLKEIAKDIGKSPEEVYKMAKNVRTGRDQNGKDIDTAELLNSKMDRILQRMDQLKQEKHVKVGDKSTEGDEEAAGGIHYHVNIGNADHSEIKIGPTYEKGSSSPVAEEPICVKNGREVRRQVTTDGPSEGASLLSQPRHNESLDSSGEDATSSVEFDIPVDPAIAPARIPADRTIVDREKDQSPDIPKSPVKKEMVLGVKKKTDCGAFDFNEFLQDDTEAQDMFSVDAKRRSDPSKPGMPGKSGSEDGNQKTESASVEVYVNSDRITKSSGLSDTIVAPPWAPASNSSCPSSSYLPSLKTDHEDPSHVEESFHLKTLDLDEIRIHTKEAGLAKPDFCIPNFPDLISEERQTEECGDMVPVQSVPVNNDTNYTTLLGVTQSEESYCDEEIHEHQNNSLVKAEQPESTQASLEDQLSEQSVKVDVYESGDFQDATNIGRDNRKSDEVAKEQMYNGQCIQEHSSKETDTVDENAAEIIECATPQIHETVAVPIGERNDHNGVPNILRDSGIELSQTHDAEGLTSGYQILSSTAATSIQPDVVRIHEQESRSDPSTTSYNMETGKGECRITGNNLQLGSSGGAVIETTSPALEPTTLKTADVASEDVRYLREKSDSETSKSMPTSTSQPQVDSKIMQNDDCAENCSTAHNSLDQSDDLEQIRTFGTWV